MKKYTAIIVDDENSALKLLEQKVMQLCSNIEVIGTFQNPEEAIKNIEKLNPDILFLDIEMPRMNGFDLLASIGELQFQVIFVTAYSEYALKAFKESAVDYILKPVDDHDLIHAVEKAIFNINSFDTNERLVKILKDAISRTFKIVVPTAKGLSLIPEDEVLHLEGYDGYTKIHLNTTSQAITSSYNLGKFEKSLGEVFFKCHKSHIVNLEHVRAFENEGYLLLDNDTRVPISRTNRKIFIELFSGN